MRLSTRFLLILGFLSVVMIVTAILTARIVLTEAALQADEERARALLKRGEAILSEEAQTLAGTLADWASWSDTYAFMADRDPRYIAVNLVEGTFDSLRVDAIIFYTTTRQPAAGMVLNPGGGLSDVIPADMRSLIERPRGLLDHVGEEALSGFTVADGQIWLVAVAPILTSAGEGPSRGAMVMGRRVDEAELQRLRQLIEPSLSLIPSAKGWPSGKVKILAHGLETLQAHVALTDMFAGGRLTLALAVPRVAFGQVTASLSYLAVWMLACGAAVWLLAVWLLNRWVLRSVSESVAALRGSLAAAATPGGTRPTLKKVRDDEIGDLVDAVDAVIGAVESSAREADRRRAEAMHSQRLASLGTMAAGVAHEINNPNGVISLNLHVLQREMARYFSELRAMGEAGADELTHPAQEWNTIVGETLLASERIAGIVASLKSFARPANDAEKESVALPDLIAEAAHWLQHDYKVARCRLACDLDPSLPRVRVNRQQLLQVFVNLLQNACQAAAKPESAVKVSGVFARKDGLVSIAVADSGRGMPAEDIARALDPFFTTRRSEGGLGLGLSISAAILKAHGGSLRIESGAETGTTVTVSLPVTEEDAHVG